MNELVRRALLGDKKSQDECTKKGIILPCPKCYNPVYITDVINSYDSFSVTFKCTRCGIESKNTQERVYVKSGLVNVNPGPLTQWNTRYFYPICRCEYCDNWNKKDSCGKKELKNYVCACHEWSDPENGMTRYTSPNDFCSYFEPKEIYKNGTY